MKPEIAFSLEDRPAEFIHDGSPPWTPTRAVYVLGVKGVSLSDAQQALEGLHRSAAKVPPEWLIDRLTLLWGMFMATRQTAGNQALVTVWLGENVRLLSDLPHDIVADAIDTAVQTAHHGFIPSVGEIRVTAQQRKDERARQIDRLALTVDLMRNGVPA